LLCLGLPGRTRPYPPTTTTLSQHQLLFSLTMLRLGVVFLLISTGGLFRRIKPAYRSSPMSLWSTIPCKLHISSGWVSDCAPL
jgi:hypothetical protein